MTMLDDELRKRDQERDFPYTSRDIAGLLGLDQPTIRRLAPAGELFAARISGKWRWSLGAVRNLATLAGLIPIHRAAGLLTTKEPTLRGWCLAGSIESRQCGDLLYLTPGAIADAMPIWEDKSNLLAGEVAMLAERAAEIKATLKPSPRMVHIARIAAP